MAGLALGFIFAPALVGACVGAVVPSAKTVLEAPQALHETTAAVRVSRDAPSTDGEPAGFAIDAEPPAVPVHAAEEKVEPETPAAPSVTRSIDRTWRLDQRRELLAYLRGDVVVTRKWSVRS